MIRTSPFATPSELKGRSVEHQWLLTEKEKLCASWWENTWTWKKQNAHEPDSDQDLRSTTKLSEVEESKERAKWSHGHSPQNSVWETLRDKQPDSLDK